MDGKLGSLGSYDLKLDGLKFVASATVQAGLVGVEASVSVSVKDALVLLKGVIPGKIDDELIDFVIAELDKQSAA